MSGVIYQPSLMNVITIQTKIKVETFDRTYPKPPSGILIECRNIEGVELPKCWMSSQKILMKLLFLCIVLKQTTICPHPRLLSCMLTKSSDSSPFIN